MADITFPALKEIQGKIDERTKTLQTVFSEAGDALDFKKVKSLKGNPFEIAEQVRAINEELNDLGKKRDDMQETLKAAERVRTAPDTREGEKGSGNDFQPSGRAQKSFGQLFVESAAFKQKQGNAGPEAMIDIDLKGLFASKALANGDLNTGDTWAPQNIRSGRVVDFVTTPIQVVDVIPQNTTNQTAVVYMEETGYGTAGGTDATEVAEGGTYPETTFELTEQSSPVRKISVYLTITDEQLEDVAQMRGYVDNRLPYMVRQRLDSQLLNGNGTAPNLKGLLNVTGIQTQAKGSDATPDAVYKAMTNVRITGGAVPNVAIFNPFDWQTIRLMRTDDGIYIWGNPSDVGISRIWGLTVTEAQVLTQGNVVVGDFANFSELAVKRGLNVQISNSHSDYFINGKQAMRADMRAAFVVYRPSAFCKVTGV
jgi:HK97 family phage major capsid protein